MPLERFAHWEDVPRTFEAWPYRFFQPVEIACRHDGSLVVARRALAMLDMLRSRLGAAVRLTSAYRCSYWNAKVGGAPNSRHVNGTAFDIALDGHDKATIERVARDLGFTGFGLNYRTFIHIDTGPARAW